MYVHTDVKGTSDIGSAFDTMWTQRTSYPNVRTYVHISLIYNLGMYVGSALDTTCDVSTIIDVADTIKRRILY